MCFIVSVDFLYVCIKDLNKLLLISQKGKRLKSLINQTSPMLIRLQRMLYITKAPKILKKIGFSFTRVQLSWSGYFARRGFWNLETAWACSFNDKICLKQTNIRKKDCNTTNKSMIFVKFCSYTPPPKCYELN